MRRGRFAMLVGTALAAATALTGCQPSAGGSLAADSAGSASAATSAAASASASASAQAASDAPASASTSATASTAPASAPASPSAVPSAAPAAHTATTATKATTLVRSWAGQPEPDRHLTPGEVFATATAATICVRGYTATVRDVPMSEREQVFAEYHIPYSAHAGYEVDHLVPLELGGDNSIRNLWPEKGRIPNPKDGLENELHNLVCRGQLALSTAQDAIRSNWAAALQRYGSTGYVYDRPAATYAPAPAPVPTQTTRPPAPVPTTTKPVNAAPPDPGNSKNCSDFSTYAAAKAWFDTYYPYYGDVAHLDSDHDGIPCESLPGAP